MKSEMFEMLKIYEQDFPDQMSEVTETEIIDHYYQSLNNIDDHRMTDLTGTLFI